MLIVQEVAAMEVGDGNLVLTPEFESTRRILKRVCIIGLLYRDTISLPLVILSYKSSALFNEIVMSQNEEIHKGCGAHTSIRCGGNKIFHLRIIIDHSNIEPIFNR